MPFIYAVCYSYEWSNDDYAYNIPKNIVVELPFLVHDKDSYGKMRDVVKACSNKDNVTIISFQLLNS